MNVDSDRARYADRDWHGGGDPKELYYRHFADSAVNSGPLGFFSRIMEGERNRWGKSDLACARKEGEVNLVLAGAPADFYPELYIRMYRELITSLIVPSFDSPSIGRVRPKRGAAPLQNQRLFVIDNEEIPFSQLQKHVETKEFQEKMALLGATIVPVRADLKTVFDMECTREITVLGGGIDLIFSDGVLACNNNGVEDILRNFRRMLGKSGGDVYYREKFHNSGLGGRPDIIPRETGFGVVQCTIGWNYFCRLIKSLGFDQHVKFRINRRGEDTSDYKERVGLLRVKPCMRQSK